MKLAEETRVREEAVIAAQAFDDINQECADHDNQARNLEMNVAKTASELRYRTSPTTQSSSTLCLTIRIMMARLLIITILTAPSSHSEISKCSLINGRKMSDTSQGRAQLFGRSIPDILREVRRTKFKEQVIGPLGMHVKIAVSTFILCCTFFISILHICFIHESMSYTESS